MANISLLSDEELFSLLKAGHRYAYEAIYKRFWPLLYVYAMKMLGDKEESQDVLQDIFLNLWNKREYVQLSGSLSAYLYASVRYKIFDLNDRKKVRTDYIASLQAFIDKGVYITDEHIREKELATRIEQEIAGLPTKMREVFELSRNTEMTYKMIGAQLNISDKTVKKQVGNAVKILRLKLGIITIAILCTEIVRWL